MIIVPSRDLTQAIALACQVKRLLLLAQLGQLFAYTCLLSKDLLMSVG